MVDTKISGLTGGPSYEHNRLERTLKHEPRVEGGCESGVVRGEGWWGRVNMAPCFFFLGYSSAGGFLETWSSGTTRRPGLLLRSTVTPREASLWMGRIARPVAAAGRETQGWRSSMLDAVPGLPSALVDPDGERHSLLVGSARGGRLDAGGGARQIVRAFYCIRISPPCFSLSSLCFSFRASPVPSVEGVSL